MANSVRKIVEDAYLSGRYTNTTFRKTPPIASVAAYWVDLSSAPGMPVPNYYVGSELVATIPTDWYKKGLWHGGAVSPYKKYLHKINLFCGTAAGAPAPFILLDYLLYYPLIDMDNTDTQFLFNYGGLDPEAKALPRYTDGVGVQAFLVATNPYIGGATCWLSYTNDKGVPGRITQMCLTNTSTNINTLVNSHARGAGMRQGAFFNLAYGDLGIRSVESITFNQANGGLAALVLVKPIATLMTRETTAWCEFDFLKDKPSLPVIYDGAYLAFIMMTSATIAGVPIIGEMTTIWGG